MLANHIILAFLALFSGIAVSAGTFAFILVVGVVPRMLRKTNLAKRIITIENFIVLGVMAGAVFSLFSWDPKQMIPFVGHILLAVYGISAGIFVGCIAVALAEILNTFPIMFRRTHVKRGLPWLLAAMAFGKMAGAFYYFVCGYWMTGG